MKLRIVPGIVLLSVASAALAARGDLTQAEKTHPDPVPLVEGTFKSTWDSLEHYQCPEWFRDAKFGIWAHWGPQCQPEQGDWYAHYMYVQSGKDGKPHRDYVWQCEHYGHPSKVGFKDVIHDWKAENWAPDKLMALYKAAGANYFMALGDHHDNFDLWDSTYQPWNSVNMGPHKDILKGWAAAARAQGLRFAVSIHAAPSWSWYEVAQGSDKTGPMKGVAYDGTLTAAQGKGQWWDGYDPQDLYAQNHPVGATPDTAYDIKFYNRVMDMLQKYRPDMVYFDNDQLPLGEWGLKIASNFYNLNAQWHGGQNEAVINGKGLNEQQQKCLVMDIERSRTPGIMPNPWQSDTCLGYWHYELAVYQHHGYKKASAIIPILLDVVSKNGNLVLNIPLKGDGTPDDDELAILQRLAAWMKVNSGGIYATRPWKIYGEGPSTVDDPKDKSRFGGQKDVTGRAFTPEDFRYLISKDGAILYAYFLAMPADHQLLLKALPKSQRVKGVSVIGSEAKISWKQNDDGLHVTLPSDYTALENIGGLKIAF